MDCMDLLLSDQTYDYITDFPIENTGDLSPVACYEAIDSAYNIVYLNRNRVPNIEADFFEYQSIPKLYCPMQKVSTLTNRVPSGAESASPPFDSVPLIVSGITQIQGYPLNLTGFGTLVCIIDSGIDYRSPLFQDEFGNTRIEAIWDQTIQTGMPPEGFLFGTEYTKNEINAALQSDNPQNIVLSTDELGHGSALASVAAGSTTSEIPGFRGAAPEAGLIVVKLKPAKQYLRDFYLLPEAVPAYQENDIMLAVHYCDRFARLFQRPIIICLGLGTSFGDHSGNSALSRYLNTIAVKRNRAVVVCGGDEGNAAHHFRGNLNRAAAIGFDRASADTDALYSGFSSAENYGKQSDVEIRVSDNNRGFFLEFWGMRPDVLNISIRSPGGEVIPAIPLGLRQSITYGFVYEKTKITIDATLVEPSSGEELVLFRFVNPTAGIWTLRISSGGDVQNGIFDLWLPVTAFQNSPVYFLQPDPYITLTEPAMASEVITISAYDPANASFYINSGRGFSREGIPRPDLAAPGVNISTIYGPQTGSAYAAALTAGAVAQFFQWAVVEGNNQFAESREIKSYLIRGAVRDVDLNYPNRTWGYGRLDMTGVFAGLRV